MPELNTPLPKPEEKLHLKECQQMSALTNKAASRTCPIRRMTWGNPFFFLKQLTPSSRNASDSLLFAQWVLILFIGKEALQEGRYAGLVCLPSVIINPSWWKIQPCNLLYLQSTSHWARHSILLSHISVIQTA